MTQGIADVSVLESIQSQQNAKFCCGNCSSMSVFNQEEPKKDEVANEDEEEKKVKNARGVRNADEKKEEVKNEDKKEEKTVVNIHITR